MEQPKKELLKKTTTFKEASDIDISQVRQYVA